MSANSYVRCWLHIVWSTLNQKKILTENARVKLSKYLYTYAKEKGIFMKTNYVCPDHVHALISLPSNLTIEEIFHLLKGNSSHWINQQDLLKRKFAWDNEKGAFSVSHSKITEVEAFIKEQEQRHWKMTFHEEFQLLLQKHEFLISRK